MKISKNTTIEDIVNEHSNLINYLSDNRIRCIRCGEPIWGTLEEAALNKGFTSDKINSIVEEMNLIIEKEK